MGFVTTPPGDIFLVVLEQVFRQRGWQFSAETRTIAMATRALNHDAEAHGVTIKFTHVHSHQGHGLNELADNVAKAGADFLHCSGLPYQLRLVQLLPLPLPPRTWTGRLGC